MKRSILLFIAILLITNINAQHTDANIFGDVKSGNEHIPFANIYIEGTTIGTTTDKTGHYMLIDLPEGKHVIVATSLGYKSSKQEFVIEANKTLEINFVLEPEIINLDEVVVTGTKTFKRSTESPVIVNVLVSKNIEAVQACNISEGLKFQPGLRVETNCQTCNYTQLRMNGLGGGYSQILINGRPIFSPLIGLYGMEQIPANMVDRIEVVRGGGSALYGSSAIGGTVNVITHIPNETDYNVSYTSHLINKESTDNVLNANVTMVSKKRNAGVVLFANRRYREAYDHKGITLNSDGTNKIEKDNYSELPELRNNSFGGNMFFHPRPNQKLGVNFASFYEYRYGGEIIDKEAHLAQQSEERVHNIFMGGIDYQLNFNNDNSSLVIYLAGQHTDREHYTGLYPAREEYDSDSAFTVAENMHLKNPPYGTTDNKTLHGGAQFNHRIRNFLIGSNVLTGGLEYIVDDIIDSIPEYHYGTNQETQNFAAFLQSDWKLTQAFTFLFGLRADKHNLVDHVIFSPRLSLLYRLKDYTQFRLTWGTGFRAPQAFDADMHIAFAGGGVSRISLDDNLKEEHSNSFSSSVNFDYQKSKYILGFTLEGFYTKLNDAFYLQPIGEDELGEQFEKRNGPGATVKGITLELRANYNKKAQFEAGITLQSSLHDEAVENIEGLEAKKEFLRTPDNYGYVILTLNPIERFNASISNLYTGSMIQAKFSPDESVYPNEYRTSKSFNEINIKLGYTFPLNTIDSGIEIYGGIKNLTNTYQNDFDNYRNRDSNYIYGPSEPRTVYIGIKLMTL
ncbi:MAG: TonB-dependent receptor [Bacteroidales bacterium]|nr:TonB-dependent receptor [Bacteroidales bacterium]MBN2697573.1 TonB-dependent receptor [Bacteroidales bacterium]